MQGIEKIAYQTGNKTTKVLFPEWVVQIDIKYCINSCGYINFKFLLTAANIGWRGGAMAGRRTYDQEVVGSIPGLAQLHNDSGQVVHTHVSRLASSIIEYQHKLGCKQAHRTIH